MFLGISYNELERYEDAVRALRYGASDFIRKPFDINDIASSVRTILKRRHEKQPGVDPHEARGC